LDRVSTGSGSDLVNPWESRIIRDSHADRLCTKSPKSHPRQWVDWFKFFLPEHYPAVVEIPPTAVGGSFKSFLREDLKYPPTAVGGITKRFRGMSVERDLNQSTHCRGWDLGLFVQSHLITDQVATAPCTDPIQPRWSRIV